MSGRNSRIVRNRDRSSSGFELDPNILKIVGIVVTVLAIIIAVIAFFVNLNKSAKVENDINAKIPYEYFLLSTEKNVGVIDKNGNTVIEAKYDVIEIPNPSKDVFICYNVDGECEMLNKNGKKILSDFENIETIISSNDNAETEKFVLRYKKDNFKRYRNLL